MFQQLLFVVIKEPVCLRLGGKMFKIVQQYRTVGITDRKRICLLTVVPGKWENNNTLFWPSKLKDHDRNRLLRIASSRPEEDWEVMDCVLKRSGIPTYSDAEMELARMERTSDTDGPKDRLSTLRRKKRKGIGNADEILVQRNRLLDSISGEILDEHCSGKDFALSDHCAESVRSFFGPKISDPIAMLLVQIAESVDELNRNVAKILMKMNFQKAASGIPPRNISEKFALKPIQTHAECVEVENRLGSDHQFKNDVVDYLGTIIGATSRKAGEGINYAYCAIDFLFSRSFLLNCSWSGASRTEHTNIAIKCQRRILGAFHSVISARDPAFSYNDMEKFFKTILNNKVSRAKNAENEGTRESRRKKRRKIEHFD